MNKLDLYTMDGWVNIPAVLEYQRDNDLPFAFVYGGRGIGKTYGDRIEIVSGLAQGEKVITSGYQKVSEGMSVNAE